MEYKLEVEDGGLRRLSFTCPAGEVLSAWKKAAQPFSASFRMAGFRPGKAPLEVVEKRFYQQISDAATDALVDAAVDDALRRETLAPAAGLVYEGGNAVRGRDFCFRMECCVLENRDVPDLSSVHIKEEEPRADPVQESLFVREILGRAAEKMSVTEGRPQDGDLVEVEVTGKMDGETVPGMHTGTCRMRLMSARPGEKTPDLDPIVRGLSVGETGSGSTPCPDNYPDPSMRGRDIELVVTLRGIERETLPPADGRGRPVSGLSRRPGAHGVRPCAGSGDGQAAQIFGRQARASGPAGVLGGIRRAGSAGASVPTRGDAAIPAVSAAEVRVS